FVDVLRRGSRQGHLEVVNHAGAVHGNRRDVAAPHQVDEHGRYARLDHVGSDAPDDARLPCARVNDRFHNVTEIFTSENPGQRVEPLLERGALLDRSGEVIDACLAASGGEGVCTHGREIELFVAEWHGQYINP